MRILHFIEEIGSGSTESGPGAVVSQRLCSSLAQETAFWKLPGSFKYEAITVTAIFSGRCITLCYQVTQSFMLMLTQCQPNLLSIMLMLIQSFQQVWWEQGEGSNRKKEMETHLSDHFFRTNCYLQVKAHWRSTKSFRVLSTPVIPASPLISSLPEPSTPATLFHRGQGIC